MQSCVTVTRRAFKCSSIRGASSRSLHASPCYAAALRTPSVASLLKASPSSAAGDVVVNGFVRSVRKQKRVAFVHLGDGSTLDSLQVVLTPEQAHSISNGAAVRVSGQWVSSQGKEQAHELHAQSVTLLSEHDAASYPLQKKYHTPDFLRTVPHLRTRLPANALLLRLRSQVIASLTSYFAERDFIQTHTPIITSSDCEGAGEVFSVTDVVNDMSDTKKGNDEHEYFFRSPKYLTVSAQLHLEALAQSVSKVWTLSPTFRAEKSDTSRHLSEFYMLEAEMCFVDGLEDVMQVVEGMLARIAETLLNSKEGEELLKVRSEAEDKTGDALALSPTELERRWRGLASTPWPRITYQQAIDLLCSENDGAGRFLHTPSFGSPLQAEHERYLAETVGKDRPVFVTDYPKSIKAFYMSPSEGTADGMATDSTAACFDLLVPDLCEIAGGSLREFRTQALLESMQAKGLTSQDSATESEQNGAGDKTLQWYVDLRRYGSAPHGGFGLGFDRLLSYLSGTSNIRDVVAFPRWHGRCDC